MARLSEIRARIRAKREETAASYARMANDEAYQAETAHLAEVLDPASREALELETGEAQPQIHVRGEVNSAPR